MTQLTEQSMTAEDKKTIQAVLTGYLFVYGLLLIATSYFTISWKTAGIGSIIFSEVLIFIFTGGIAAFVHKRLFSDVSSGKVMVAEGMITEMGSWTNSRNKFICFDFTGAERILPIGNALKFRTGDQVKVRIAPKSKLLVKIETIKKE